MWCSHDAVCRWRAPGAVDLRRPLVAVGYLDPTFGTDKGATMSGNARRAQRRAAEIHFYAGTNGGGKSFAAVYDTIPTLESGRPVLSTVRLLDPSRVADSVEHARDAWGFHGVEHDLGKHSNPLALPHPLYVRWTNFGQLLDWSRGDVLADEVQGIFSSRAHGSTPHQVVNGMLQLRRDDCAFRATAPSFARLDVAVREVTKAVTLCSGYMKEPVEGRLWGASRLFLWRTFDALDLDEWDASAASDSGRQPKSVRQFLWRPRHPDVTRYYDTFAPVDEMEDPYEAGRCLRCGGNRPRPKCSCDVKGGGEDGRQPARSAAQPAAPLEVAS